MLRITGFILAIVSILSLSNTLALSCVILGPWALPSLRAADAIFVGKFVNADLWIRQEKLQIPAANLQIETVARFPATAKLGFEVVGEIKGQLPEKISIVWLDGIHVYNFSLIPKQNYLLAIKKLDQFELLRVNRDFDYVDTSAELYKLIDSDCSGPAITEYTEKSMLNIERSVSRWNPDLYSLLGELKQISPSMRSEGEFPNFGSGRTGSCCGQF